MKGLTAIVGVVLGALLGVALCGWEQVGLWALGVPPVAPSALPAVVAVCAAISGLLGGLAGLAGLRRGRWLLFTLLAGSGWLGAGRVVGLLLDWSVPPLVGGALSVAGGLLVALLAVLVVRSHRLAQASSMAVFFGGLALLLLNQHWLASPLTRVALVVDGLVLALAAVLGGLLTLVLPERGLGLWPASLGLGVSGWGLAWAVSHPPQLAIPAEAAGHPTVVLVIVDTLRFDRLDQEHAPQLWQWGQGALRYTDATAPAPWTLPSVATVMTGLPPSGHGAGVHDGTRNLRSAIAPVPTLAEHLTAAGGVVAGVTTNPWTGAAYGFARGTHHWDERLGPGPVPVGLHGLLAVGLPVPWPAYRPAAEMLAEADRLLLALPASGGLLVVHLMDVHGPYDPATVDPTDPTVAYDAAVAGLDAVLGVWLATLPETHRVVLLSDHGEELVEHRRVQAGVPDGTRHGHSLYQELVHVPLWLRGPGMTPGEVHRPVGLDQVAATVLTWAGQSPPEGMAPPLAEAVGAPVEPARVLELGAVRFGPRTLGARLASHKRIEWHGSREDARLFDLSVDPEEAHDARGSVPEVEARLQAVLDGAIATPGPEVAQEAQLRDLLERLGYAE